MVKAPTLGRSSKIAEKVAQKQAREEYIHRKMMVMERERRNNDRVILFRSRDKWWKIAGRSVLYYSKLVSPLMPKEKKVQADSDYHDVSETGVILIPDIDKFLEEVKAAGFDVEKVGNENYRAVHLHNRISEEDYNLMVKAEAYRWESMERMITPRVMWPEIKRKLTLLGRNTREGVRTLSRENMATIGDRMMQHAMDMMETFQLTATGVMPPLEGIELLEDTLARYEGIMYLVIEMRLFKQGKVQDIADMLARLKKLVGMERSKLVKGGLDELTVREFEEITPQTPQEIVRFKKIHKEKLLEEVKKLAEAEAVQAKKAVKKEGSESASKDAPEKEGKK